MSDVQVLEGELLPEKSPEPTALVRLALEQGVGVDVLERLVALEERVQQRNARAAFFEALAGFQEEVPEVHKAQRANIKTKSGSKFNYTYAGLPDITRTIRPVLRRHGLSYSWTVEQGEHKGILDIVCILRHVEGHEERATFPTPIGSEGRMSAAQESGAALTYGKRQSLTSVLGLTTADEDTDGVGPSESVQPVNAGQVADLEAMIEEVRASKVKLLAWLEVGSLDELTMGQYDMAVTALEAQRKGGKNK